METIEAIKSRRSIRKFLNKPVPKKLIEEIVDCARLAPTAVNVQPWEFIVVTEKRTIKEIANITDHGKFIAHAPVCIAVFCKETKYYLEDGAAATENILLATHALGLGACWVAGDKKSYVEEIRNVLKVPDGFRLISLIPIGYSPEKGSCHKRTLEEVIHWEKY